MACQPSAHVGVERPQLRIGGGRRHLQLYQQSQGTSKTSARLGMPRVRFQAANTQQGVRGFTMRDKEGCCRASFDRVAQRSACAVRLQHGQPLDCRPRIRERRGKDALLRLPVGRCQARTPPVLPHRTPHHS